MEGASGILLAVGMVRRNGKKERSVKKHCERFYRGRYMEVRNGITNGIRFYNDLTLLADILRDNIESFISDRKVEREKLAGESETQKHLSISPHPPVPSPPTRSQGSLGSTFACTNNFCGSAQMSSHSNANTYAWSSNLNLRRLVQEVPHIKLRCLAYRIYQLLGYITITTTTTSHFTGSGCRFKFVGQQSALLDLGAIEPIRLLVASSHPCRHNSPCPAINNHRGHLRIHRNPPIHIWGYVYHHFSIAPVWIAFAFNCVAGIRWLQVIPYSPSTPTSRGHGSYGQ